MAKAAKKRAAKRREMASEALGIGLHGGYVELESGGTFRVRLGDGRRFSARPGAGVDAGLVRDCLRTRRMVIVVDSPRGPRIMGALQTEAPIAQRDQSDSVTVRARELRLVADEKLHIEAGPVRIAADASGKLRLEGDKLVIDMAALVKLLSTSVELP